MNESMNNKISKVYYLATKLGYDKNCKDDRVWKLIDFGYSHEFSVLDGKCSLQKSLDFSMETWENKINVDLEYLEDLENKIEK